MILLIPLAFVIAIAAMIGVYVIRAMFAAHNDLTRELEAAISQRDYWEAEWTRKYNDWLAASAEVGRLQARRLAQ